MAEGYYSNATELVRDAVRRLREQDDQSYGRMIAALHEGEKAIAEGRHQTYSPALLDQIEQDARRHAAASGQVGPDVRP